MIRHLLYSVYAAAHTEEWIQNIIKLTKYASIFNGRKIVIVRSDENTVLPQEVELAFTFPVEFVHVKNNELQETSYFIENIAKFKFQKSEIEEEETLFYAHTKGVKYRTERQIIPVRLWRNAMYEACLEDIDKIDRVLQKHPCAGSFIMLRGFNTNIPQCRWHFSGNFWWVKLKRLFERQNWTFVAQHTHGVEAYLGSIFNYNEAFNITYTMADLNRYQLTKSSSKLLNDGRYKGPFTKKGNSKLFCIITGMENSGTTVLARIMMSAPNLFGGFECGMLLGKNPQDFKNVYPFFERMPQQIVDLTGTRTVPDDSVIVKYLSWGLTREGMNDILASDTHMEMYERLHKNSSIMKPDDLIIDKTPRYVYNLPSVIERTNGEIPLIVVEKSYKEIKMSRIKRGVSMKETVQGYVKSKRAIDSIAHLKNVFVVEYKNIGDQLRNIFTFLGLEWKDEYLSLDGYNKKTEPFGVKPAKPSWFIVPPLPSVKKKSHAKRRDQLIPKTVQASVISIKRKQRKLPSKPLPKPRPSVKKQKQRKLKNRSVKRINWSSG